VTGRRRRCGDDGVVGGAEVLPLSVLVFVGGILLVTHLWGVVDARAALDAATRDAARAYVEAPDPATAEARARSSAAAALAGRGRKPERLHLRVVHPDGRPWGRCVPVEVEASYDVAQPRLPWQDHGSTMTVHSRSSEVIDPWRSGLDTEAAFGQAVC